MDYQSYSQEWLTRRIDFNHSGTYLEQDLLQEYLFSCYGLAPKIDSLQAFWEQTDTDFDAKFYKTTDQDLQQGDIVLIKSFTHAGIFDGQQTPERFEMLEQNAVGSQTGIGDDAIRTNWYDKVEIAGVWRPRRLAVYAPPTPAKVTPVEPLEPTIGVTEEPALKPYKAPTGAVTVPLARTKLYIKVPLDTYNSSNTAATRSNPNPKRLNPGSYETDLHKQGMLRIIVVGALSETWINPNDNVVRPKAPPVIVHTRINTYKEWHYPEQYQANKGYMKTHNVGEVFNFGGGANATIKKHQPVYIQGEFIDGEHHYAVPANKQPDGTFKIMSSYGILFSYLSLMQEEYVPEDDIQDVKPAPQPRVLSTTDNLELIKAQGVRLIDGFFRNKRR